MPRSAYYDEDGIDGPFNKAMAKLPRFRRAPKTYAAPAAWIKLGARADYRDLRGGPVTHANREVLSEPWKLGHGQWVVKIEGVVGGVAVEHLEEAARAS